MGRRRRRIVKRLVRSPPTIFLCPVCNREAVTVSHEKDAATAVVTCASCKTSREVKWLPMYAPIDAYCAFYDEISKGLAPEPINVAENTMSQNAAGTDQPPSKPQ